ncbi:MAG: PAS domain-containing protein, partial [Haloarculaceae archaeon]
MRRGDSGWFVFGLAAAVAVLATVTVVASTGAKVGLAVVPGGASGVLPGGLAVGLLGLAVGHEPDSAIARLADEVEAFDPREDDWAVSLDRDDEVGRLADALEEMTGRMRDYEHELAASERYRQELYRITSSPDLSGEEKIEALLDLGCERLGVVNGIVTRVDEETGRYEIRTARGGDFVEAGTVTDLSNTFCRHTIESADILGIYDADAEGHGDDPAAEEWGIRCYIGGKVEVEDDLSGTVCFVSPEPRDQPFSHTEKAFVDLLARWVSHELERRERERELDVKTRAMEAAPLGITIADADRSDNPLIYVNEEFQRLTGYDAEECLGRNCRFLQGEGTSEDRVATIREAIEAAEPVTVELRNYRQDGTEFWN